MFCILDIVWNDNGDIIYMKYKIVAYFAKNPKDSRIVVYDTQTVYCKDNGITNFNNRKRVSENLIKKYGIPRYDAFINLLVQMNSCSYVMMYDIYKKLLIFYKNLQRVGIKQKWPQYTTLCLRSCNYLRDEMKLNSVGITRVYKHLIIKKDRTNKPSDFTMIYQCFKYIVDNIDVRRFKYNLSSNTVHNTLKMDLCTVSLIFNYDKIDRKLFYTIQARNLINKHFIIGIYKKANIEFFSELFKRLGLDRVVIMHNIKRTSIYYSNAFEIFEKLADYYIYTAPSYVYTRNQHTKSMFTRGIGKNDIKNNELLLDVGVDFYKNDPKITERIKKYRIFDVSYYLV